MTLGSSTSFARNFFVPCSQSIFVTALTANQMRLSVSQGWFKRGKVYGLNYNLGESKYILSFHKRTEVLIFEKHLMSETVSQQNLKIKSFHILEAENLIVAFKGVHVAVTDGQYEISIQCIKTDLRVCVMLQETNWSCHPYATGRVRKKWFGIGKSFMTELRNYWRHFGVYNTKGPKENIGFVTRMNISKKISLTWRQKKKKLLTRKLTLAIKIAAYKKVIMPCQLNLKKYSNEAKNLQKSCWFSVEEI